MEISKLNRKGIFAISQKLNSLYKNEKMSDDTFLRLMYYYFLSSKQITYIFKILKLSISSEISLIDTLKKIDSLKEYDFEKYETLKKEVENKIGYFIDISYLAPILAESGFENIDMVEFIKNTYMKVIDSLNINVKEYGFNELIIYREEVSKLLTNIYSDLKVDLVFEVDKLVKDGVFRTRDSYSELFDYLISYASKVNFIEFSYIPNFLINIVNKFISFSGKYVNSIVFDKLLNTGVATQLSERFDETNTQYSFNYEFERQIESDFFAFSNSLKNVKYQTLFKSQNAEIYKADLVISYCFNPKSINIPKAYDFFPQIDKYKKLNSTHIAILSVIDQLNYDGFGVLIVETSSLIEKPANSKIQEQLVKDGYIRAVIALPSNLIERQASKLSMVVLQRPSQEITSDVLFINAILDYKKNEKMKYMDLFHVNNLGKILADKKEYPHFSKLAPFEEIASSNFSLNVEEYVPTQQSVKSQLSVKNMLSEAYQAKDQLEYMSKDMEQIAHKDEEEPKPEFKLFKD